ncbi:MAG: outer membrane protein assembly factor BamD [Gemmatimonadaceae bacterium]
MTLPRIATFLLGVLLLASAACRGTVFRPANFKDNRALFDASVKELERRNWDNAVAGFERLTLELPARDPLMTLSLFYLGKAHEGKKENLLAAQSYTRIVEGFPDDTLADDGLLLAGRAYARLWRRPDLDAQYGETALSTFQTMLALFPSSPLKAEAEKEVARLNQWFATKLYENGMHYFGRKAYDSAIIYFTDVGKLYPDTPRARDALIRLAQAYDRIRYRDDASETCAKLRQTYPGDREVAEVCGVVPRTAASSTP